MDALIVQDDEAGVNFRAADGVREQVVGYSPVRRSGTAGSGIWLLKVIPRIVCCSLILITTV